MQGEHAAGSRFEARTTRPASLVGREEEVALLVERWHQAQQGDGQVVLLYGEPGIGKSRITRALSEQVVTNSLKKRRAVATRRWRERRAHGVRLVAVEIRESRACSPVPR